MSHRLSASEIAQAALAAVIGTGALHWVFGLGVWGSFGAFGVLFMVILLDRANDLEGRPCAMTAAVMTSKPVQSRRGIDCWYVGTVYRSLRHVGGRAVRAEGHDDPNAPTRGCWSFQPFHGGEPIIVLGRDLKRVRNGKALG
jgi:hypothetical protein